MQHSGIETSRAPRAHRMTPVISVCVLACVCLAPPGARAQQKSFYPLDKGNAWTYSFSVGKLSGVARATVVAVTRSGAGVDSTVDWSMNGRIVQHEVLRTTRDGLYRLKGGTGATLSPPLPLMRFPVASGRTWKWKGTITLNGQSMSASSTLSVSGPSVLTTPAGTFRAWKVQSDLTLTPAMSKPLHVPNSYWFAPGVGLVAQSLPSTRVPLIARLTKYSVK